MASCINPNSLEFQTLKNKSGLPDLLLKTICGMWLEKYNRFPTLYELGTADSSKYLSLYLQIDKNNIGKVNELLEITNSESVEEAQIKLNLEYSDLDIKIAPFGNTYHISFKRKPSQNKFTQTLTETHLDTLNSPQLFRNLINNLLKSLGIQVHSVDTSTIKEMFGDTIPEALNANAFVYNGEIYVNTDFADIDAPIHEMMHLLLGNIRMTHPEIYLQVVAMAEKLPNYELLIKLFMGRTHNDINEELFVKEFAKFVCGRANIINNLDDNIKYEFLNSIAFVLDTMLMGKNSVKFMPTYSLFQKSLKELSLLVDSQIDKDEFNQNASLHRLVANEKQSLFEQGLLKEYC